MDDDCRKHTQDELLPDGVRIVCLERLVADLRRDVASLTQQLILIREDEPRQIAAAVNEAVDMIEVKLAEDAGRIGDFELRLGQFQRKMNALFEALAALGDAVKIDGHRLAALEASDKQTVRHVCDNDTDLADIKRRLAALERQQPPDLDAEQVAYIVGLGGGIAWGGLE